MLSPIKSKTSVRRMVFIDTETIGYPTDIWKGTGEAELHLLRLGWALFWDSGKDRPPKEFHTPDEFFEHLEAFIGKSKDTTFVYDYNGSFDYQVLGVVKRVSQREGWRLFKAPIEDPFIMEAYYRNRPVWFLDMGNHLGEKPKLSRIGDEIGLPKLGVDAARLDDYPDEEVSKYCYRDAEIVREYMLRWLNFLKDNDLGPYRPTIAGQCLTTFRHRFIENSILIHHQPYVSIIEREAYKGGRNEPWYVGSVDMAYKLDVNSFHPFVMSTKALPCGLVYTQKHPGSRFLKELMDKDRLFIIKGKFYIPKKAPVISVRMMVPTDHVERTILPVGVFDATITSVEYKQLLSEGGKMMSGEFVSVYDSAVLFKGYIDFFYQMRLKYKKEKNKTLDSMSKYFMNSLEGKFAQHVEESIEIKADEKVNTFTPIIDAKNRYPDVCIKEYGGRKFMYTRTKMDSAQTFTAISAFIRAWTRVILWDDIRTIYKAGGVVYYMDTDSIFCDDKGFEALMNAGRVDPNRLGAFKLEESGPLTIRNTKDYTMNGVDRIKGVRKDAVYKDGVYYQTMFVRMGGMLRRGIDEGVLIVQNTEKRLSHRCEKGTVDGEGWVHPYELDD